MNESPVKKLILTIFVTISMAMTFLPWMGIDYGKASLSKESFESSIRETQTYLGTIFGGVSLFGIMSPEEQQFTQELMPLAKASLRALEDSGISQYEAADLTVRFTMLVSKNRNYASEILGADTNGVITMLTGISVFMAVLLLLTAVFYLLAVRSIWNGRGKGFRIAFLIQRILAFALFVYMVIIFNRYYQDPSPVYAMPAVVLRLYLWSFLALFFALPAGFHNLYLSKIPALNKTDTPPVLRLEETLSITEPEPVIPSGMQEAAVETWTCPECGSANGIRKNFCENCGSKKPLICPHCGKETPAGSKFCGACGKPILRTDQ